MEHKKFMDIERLKGSYTYGFQKGDIIQITEKIDGANAALRYDSSTDCVAAQSRKNILNPTNNLRGFYEWTQLLGKDKVKEVLGENKILFGEWLVPHTVKYPNERYNKFYCYDVYDTSAGMYLPQNEVKEIVKKLGLIYVPVFYEGEFISWEHCMRFVGKTELGGESGEGIVIKNQTRLNDKNTRLPFYVKIVSEKFSETKGHSNKTKTPEELKARESNISLAETIVTKPRIEKILNKLVDEGILSKSWTVKDMPIVAKNLTKEVIHDCVKEENEIVQRISDFGKAANSISMKIAKEIAVSRC